MFTRADKLEAVALCCAAISTFWVAYAFREQARLRGRKGLAGDLRGHYRDLAVTMVILAFFFLLEGFYKLNLWRLNLAPSSGATIAIATASVIIGVVTNLYLRRAILQLDFYEHLKPEYLKPTSPDDRFLAPSVLQNMKSQLRLGDSIDRWVIGIGLLAVCYLVILSLAGIKPTKSLLLIASTPQLAVSGVLLLWLSVIYSQLRAAHVLTLGAMLYGGSHVVTALSMPFFDFGYSLIVVSGLKIIFANVVLFKRHLLPALPDEAAAVLHEASVFAARRRRRRRLHAASSAFVVGLAIIFYPYAAYRVMASAATPTGVLGVACFLCLLIAGQGLFALYQKYGRYEVRWRIHGNATLYKYMRYQRVQDAGQGWRHEVLSRTGAQPWDPVEVVLVHGLFGRATTTWGLLPLILLLSKGNVARVHLLSYEHGVVSFGRRLRQLPKELARALASISRDYPGRLCVYGHSLGGMLAVNAYKAMRANEKDRVTAIILVAAPLRGSWKAWIGAPWFSGLAPWSKYPKETLSVIREELTMWRRDGLACRQPTALSIMVGSQDDVIADTARLLGIPRSEVFAERHGTIAAPFHLDGALGKAYVRELVRAAPGFSMLRVVWGILGSERSIVAGWIVQISRKGGLIRTVEALDQYANGIVPLGVMRMPAGGSVAPCLRSVVERICGTDMTAAEAIAVDEGIARIESFLVREHGEHPFFRVSWVRNLTMYAMCEGEYALLILVDEAGLIALRKEAAAVG